MAVHRSLDPYASLNAQDRRRRTAGRVALLSVALIVLGVVLEAFHIEQAGIFGGFGLLGLVIVTPFLYYSARFLD